MFNSFKQCYKKTIAGICLSLMLFVLIPNTVKIKLVGRLSYQTIMTYKPKALSQLFLAVSIFGASATFAGNPTSEVQNTATFEWIQAPSRGEISGKAHIKLKDDLLFLGTEETKRFLVATGNLPVDNSYTLASKELGWFSIFHFTGDGYVKDDDKIDNDALLQTLKEINEKSVEVRKHKNLPLLYLDGWYIGPYYDTETKRLEWATKIHDENNSQLVNFTVRLLGREGYISATLVSEPTNLQRDIRSFKSALKGYEFNAGERYSEFKSGDKVAAYGLGALVVGGAAAAVASKGGFKFLGYIAIAAFGAIGAFFKKLFSKK